MNTNSPKPEHDELKALLANSFHAEEADQIPPLPDDLRERIRDQYGKDKPPVRAPSAERSESLFAKLSRLISQPAFSGAAAAVILLAVAAIFLIPKEEIRGPSDTPALPVTKIVIVGFPAAKAKAISKELDPKTVKIVADLSGHIAEDGSTIVIDGSEGKITGYHGPGSTMSAVPLPDIPAEIAYEVATMARELQKKDREEQ